ncbi:FAD-dependent oxidoreductase [Nocardia terpenica]|uniref:FAD-dependent oxidoreductase n=1 Tax=Nocardia terpenica TaxID=455432 RepID=UPI0018958E34|nr:FAD-dependent oxidoreductase [Nocardia terpenica]MBF6059845.1 FAD-dependent oxidoreductase [Nocardia terpenica]MBF6102614.1 FAD-dependent oxidoreductase [Nocardia terpenica]MBF6111195.1 FAD-dependent oxidoreductase [Nocardia terpenica]MBF6117326.1 FAD-dependent oxidoreductase [Nocardia terpenica]MBF6150833.1 FAD-dependent oxidoreductase [Nocardia terpenica]
MSLLHLLWLFRLAAQLEADHIHLDAPVRRIGQTGNGVVVETDDATAHGLRAIIATPIPQVVKIDFAPQLPPALAPLSRINVGAGTKVIARLPRGHTVGHNSVLGGQYLWAAWRRGD